MTISQELREIADSTLVHERTARLRALADRLESEPITIGVLVEAGMVTEIRATHPEITLILADADTQDEDAEKAYNESRAAFEQLPHIIFE